MESKKGFVGKTIASIKDIFKNTTKAHSKDIAFSFIFFFGLIVYLELMLHLLIYRSIGGRIIYPILFAIPTGFLLAFFVGIFDTTVNKILMWVFTGIYCLLFCVQLVYYSVFKMYFSFQSLSIAGDAFSEFSSDIISAIKDNFGGIILFLIPLIILRILMIQFIYCERRDRKEQGLLLAGTVFLHILTLGSLLLFGKGDYTPYDLYHHTKVQDLCGKQLGIVTMMRFDIIDWLDEKDELVLADYSMAQLGKQSNASLAPTPKSDTTISSNLKSEITSTSESKTGLSELNSGITTSPEAAKPIATSTPTPTLPPTPTPIDTSPNVMNIDFAALAESEKDKTVKTLHQYFGSAVPTNKNEYTGMFKGYNLIMITAEGFSPYAVNKEKTPTLYKLTREGFVFNNFYTALWQTSTSDGEYVAMTGLIPVGTRSMYHSRNNLIPFALGNQFNRIGVESKAYHNHSYAYYQRNETHPNLGYIFKGVGNGLVLETDCWPESDLEMINATPEEYTKEEQFHIYYLTVSGHMNYTFIGNSMAYKNRDLVMDLPYSSDAKAYIACQIELDRALEQLIKNLEEAGVADRTVIALSADHYPYGWDKSNLDELAGHVIDPDFEIYKNNFILWNAGMKENIVVDKPCSSLDILPTLSNLFGLEYDSRLLMGRDILSDADPLVILSNGSFITDKVMYNSGTREIINLTGEEVTKDYISNLNSEIKNKFNVSKSIVKKDYYRYLFPDYIVKTK